MSYVAEIVGGPRDGERIALARLAPVRFPVAPPRIAAVLEEVDWPMMQTIEISPVLTGNGWRLYWPTHL
jgi:hypothetical protein